MPRTGGIYYLPSPPSPLQPNTLAAAEDVMTIYQDIATAITGSMALDGSTAFTGPVNFNNQAISGIGNLTASGTITGNIVTAGNYMSTPTYYGTNISVSGTIQANGHGRIISNSAGANPSVTVWDTSQGIATGMFLGGGGTLYWGQMDGNGNYTGVVYGSLTTGGVFNAPGGLGTSGNLTASGNASISGSLSTGSNVYCAGLNIQNGDIQMNGHNILTVANITGSGNLIGFLNDLTINGHNLLNVGAISGYNGAITFTNYCYFNNVNLYNIGEVHCVTIFAQNYNTRMVAVSDPVGTVRKMAHDTKDLNVGQTLSALIAAVAELSEAIPVPA